MIKYIIKSTYKTYHGKIGYFFLLLLIIGNLIHSWLLGNIWPESIYDPIVGFDLQVFPHPTIASLVIVESTTNWNGMGSLLYQTILNQDSNAAMGLFLLLALLTIILRITISLIQMIIDPRVRAK